MNHALWNLLALRWLLTAVLTMAAITRACGLEPASDPNLAVVRIKSHGASGTIIATTEGKSWILGCAHMFMDQTDQHLNPKYTQKKFRIDGPPQPHATKKVAEVRLLAADPQLDLSLMVIDNGPFHYLPVAPRGHQRSKSIHSVGYDNMQWPITNKPATIIVTGPDWTYTREKPWHGRSGGGLIDVEARALIGVVHGYEIGGQQRGIYVSHDAVLRFLDKHLQTMPSAPQANPEPVPFQRYAFPGPWQPGPLCPS